MRLYERLGLPKEKIRVDIWKDEFVRLITQPVKDQRNLPYIKADMVSNAKFLTHDYYYLEEKEEAKESARNLLDYTKEFFFGKWRNEIPGYPSDTENWIEQFRQSICWGSCIGEWEKIKEIAEYPKENVIEAERWEPIEFRCWYLLIAGVLRGQQLSSLEKYVKTIEEGGKRREKLLLKLLMAIIGKNIENAENALNGYLKYFKKYEFPRPGKNDLLCIDGTFLINFAAYKNLKIDYPSEYDDYIVKL